MAAAEDNLPDEVTVPSFIDQFLDPYRQSLLHNRTKPVEAHELNSLVWGSFRQEFSLDPKTLGELLTLKPGSSKVFQRELSPELFHWAGTSIYFLDLHLLKPLWLSERVGLHGALACKLTQSPLHWALHREQMCSAAH